MLLSSRKEQTPSISLLEDRCPVEPHGDTSERGFRNLDGCIRRPVKMAMHPRMGTLLRTQQSPKIRAHRMLERVTPSVMPGSRFHQRARKVRIVTMKISTLEDKCQADGSMRGHSQDVR